MTGADGILAWAAEHALICPRCQSADWTVEQIVGRLLCLCFHCGHLFGADDALRVLRARQAQQEAA